MSQPHRPVLEINIHTYPHHTMGFEKEKKSVPRSERKAKKRKAEDAIPDVPEDYADEEPVEEKSSKKRKHTEDDEAKPEKKSKKEKKDKVEKDADVEMKEVEKDDDDKAQDGEEGPRLSKKERKALRKAKEAAEKAANPLPEGAPLETETSKKEASDKKTDDSAKATPAAGAKPVRLDADGNPIKKKNNRNREKKRLAAAALAASGEKAPPRFIVFVGNLPYTATKEKIEKHFAAVHPKSVRHLTDKATGKSRGTAFVEFEGYDHMKTALRTMHHTTFEDGTKEGRKINVELTAGGGGNTKDRKAKIYEKNHKLTEQRTRKIGEEEKQKLEKRGIPAADQSGIHPSRRARVA